MPSSQPIHVRDASQAATAGCFFAIPVAIFLGMKFALKAAGEQEHAGAHQIEDMGLELSDASSVPAEESLGRFIVALRRTVEPFDKMGARFERGTYETEIKRLEGLKRRFQTEGKAPGPDAQQQIREAEQLLARYKPN